MPHGFINRAGRGKGVAMVPVDDDEAGRQRFVAGGGPVGGRRGGHDDGVRCGRVSAR